MKGGTPRASRQAGGLSSTAIAIDKINGISDPSQIQVGAYIFIPGQPAPSGPSQLIVHIGRFYPSDSLDDLKPGKKFRVTLNLTRSLGEDSGTEPEIKIEQKL